MVIEPNQYFKNSSLVNRAGRGRRRRADGEGTSQVNGFGPHYEPQHEQHQMEDELQVEGDDGHVEVEAEPEQLDESPGGPHDLSI